MKTNVFLPHWHAASDETREAGENWYLRAQTIVYRWASIYEQPLAVVAGVIAVLSQRQRWQSNLLQAERCLQGHVPKGIKSAVDKALRIMSYVKLSENIRGPKIEAFYRAILGDDQSIVLDSHMVRAAYLDKKALSVKQYYVLADILRAEAESVGVPPAHFQAVVWCQIRGRAD